MIKVLYREDGTIADFWAVKEIPTASYIEISDEIHSQIINKDHYIVQNGAILDISNTPLYISKINEEENIKRQNEIKAQILNIETQQNRAIREVLLNNNEYSKSKLEEIERQIENLRTQI